MSHRTDLSRRDFLKATGMALGTSSLVGIGPLVKATALASEAKVPVGIARGETVGGAVQKAVELAGGMEFVQRGQTVLVKPNVNKGDAYPASTNPEVLYEIIKLVWEQDPKRVIVGDRCMFRRNTLEEMKRAGIDQATHEAKAELVTFDDMKWKLMNPAKSVNWQNGYHVAEIVTQVDHIINVPVTKTHFLAWFTMSIKNFVGIIHGDDRITFHKKLGGFRRRGKGQPPASGQTGQQPKADYPAFAKMIAEFGLAVKPTLNIMDGTKAFVSHGPSRGDLVEPKLIVASRDRIATDVTGIGILKHYGTEDRLQNTSVWQQPMIAHGISIGLGVSDLSRIVLKGDKVPELEQIRKQMI